MSSLSMASFLMETINPEVAFSECRIRKYFLDSSCCDAQAGSARARSLSNVTWAYSSSWVFMAFRTL
ncbi:MAG: hypothetical protein NTZ74_02235 [Chloroflexi bacterium]|nr:hypothetical protein [Chloroflexota bacterium]